MTIRIEICLCIVLVFIGMSQCLSDISQFSNEDEDFNYNTNSFFGPANWGHYYRDCTYPQQSPININTKKVIYGLNYNISYKTENQPGSLVGKLHNNGNGLKFSVIPQTFLIGVPGYNHDPFVLNQIHIHLGKTFTDGSEHSVNRRFYPAELHLVHYNTKYISLKEAIKGTLGVTVVAVFLEIISTPSNGELDKLIYENVENLIHPDDQPINTEISLSAILPDDLSFYTYIGSLTTPPCSGNVRWIVLQHTIKINRKFIMALRRIRNKQGMRVARFGNYRPTQRRGFRRVEANFYDLFH